MELIVIGCWAAYPDVNEACSGYLIRQGQTSILVDCGHSVFAKLGQYVPVAELDAVIISHLHPDHYIDLYALNHAVRSAVNHGKRRRPLQVFLPDKPIIFDYFAGKSELIVQKLEEGLKPQVGELQLEFFSTCHTEPGFAVKISAQDSALFYSGDTIYHNKLVEASSGVNLLLLETSMVEAEQEYALTRGHMSTRDVASWAGRNQPDLLVATHFWEGYDLAQIHSELAAGYEGEFVMAYEGLKVEL